MMDFCEELLRTTVDAAIGSTRVRFDEHEIDFGSKFDRLTMKQAICEYWSRWIISGAIGEEINEEWLDSARNVSNLVTLWHWWEEIGTKAYLYHLDETHSEEKAKEELYSLAVDKWQSIKAAANAITPDALQTGHNILHLFESIAERDVTTPTFIIDFPNTISPLSKASPGDPSVAERFELYVAGMEIANGFSELNDPVEQHQRFEEQTRQRERGDEEAMQMDEDYIRALSYGMPPAAGIGIGIDRLVMLLTNRKSIRDVILFPHMRPAAQKHDGGEERDEAVHELAGELEGLSAGGALQDDERP
jgi:lysyl-tRNA synthetase class 2